MKKEKLGTKPTLYLNSSISRSLSQLSLSSLVSKPSEYFFRKAKIVEKEYESIAEEASVQSIQSPVVKRDQSVDSAKIQKSKISKNYKERIFCLENDLLNVRNEYLRILEEKLKLEKDLVFAHCKIKTLEKNNNLNAEKIAELQRKIDNFLEKEVKHQETTAKVEELTRILAEISEKSEKDHKESLKYQIMCEEKIEQLKRNSVVYKTELSYKDDYCETLKQQIEALKSLSKDHYENKAVKNLSYIILSKDKHISTDPLIKQKELELEYDLLLKNQKKTKLKCKKQKD